MVKASPPSQNSANSSSLAGALSFAMRKYLQDTDDMLPAQVISFNRATNRAQLQIMIPMVTTGGQVQQRAPIASVPVLQLGGGGFVVSFPLQAGDLGWIKASDRDISIFKKTLSSSSGPPTQRFHKFSDAMFIPDSMMNNVTLADSAGFCIQSSDGTLSIAFNSSTDTITIASPTKIILSAPEIDINSPLCKINGIAFGTHVHTGVQTGGGESGGPVNP